MVRVVGCGLLLSSYVKCSAYVSWLILRTLHVARFKFVMQPMSIFVGRTRGAYSWSIAVCSFAHEILLMMSSAHFISTLAFIILSSCGISSHFDSSQLAHLVLSLLNPFISFLPVPSQLIHPVSTCHLNSFISFQLVLILIHSSHLDQLSSQLMHLISTSCHFN